MEQVKNHQEHSLLGRKPLEYYQNKIMKEKKGDIWCKDQRINYPVGDELQFDDFFKITNKNYRIFKFTVGKRVENSYICGLQFHYQNIQNPDEVVQGFAFGPNDLFTNNKYQTKSFTLQDDEFIVEMKGRKGMIIDCFGVVTNKGNEYSFGGTGGGEYSQKAPKGYHFTCMGGYFSPGWDSISSFTMEVRELPFDDGENQRRLHSYSLKSYKPAFRKLVDFLTTSEVTKLFRLNKDFARFRHDDYVLTKIGCRCIYSGVPKSIKYIKKMIKYCPQDEVANVYEKIMNYFNLIQNFVSNPDGRSEYEGFQKVQNGGDGITIQKSEKDCNFITSYGWCTLKWSKSLKEIFSDKSKYNLELLIGKIQSGNYAIVAGAQICETGFGGEASLKIEILGEDENVLFQFKRDIKDLTREYKFYNLKYIHSWPDKVPHKINFYISGKDTCFWAGHYGAKFKSITVKIIPIEDEQEKVLFEKYIN
ncbi:F-box associated region protein (macronuclear) [Tetrahymena thermophila SB210]|uniref:F-box associated region protein n=1 Tax=Tetrahymena thermophila (strain SB210) TaxID=312017 RepID=Q23U25_TETTS|nr:F-box associated region protein [Tetrahymena thermophila SB210]EAS00025.2 F-box associated region protein [Tetrahymena thermophila SB210]|eukprot:XP_001020270.2 F-box associated region protein [Tetrahymena thermophila SB210]